MQPQASQAPLNDQSPASAIEVHSIDWVPNHERHGTVRHLGALWFVSNINLTAMATGVVTLSLGAGLMWTIIATLLGSLFGTFFMAFHSAQGPHLGLPQLVQSRAQFGYLGAAFTVWIFALINYVAYNTSDALLSGAAMNSLFGLDHTVGYLVAAAVATVIALYGYHWIHLVNRMLTVPLLLIMAGLTLAALQGSTLPANAYELGHFEPAAFATVFVIVAGFQLGWAPYVSDYSRYLPSSTRVAPTFWWTYVPSAVSALWVFILGTIMGAAAGEDHPPVEAFWLVGDSLFSGFGSIAVLGLLIGLLAVMAINQYGGMMAMISILDSVVPVKPSRRLRAICIGVMFVLVFGISQWVGEARFNTFYGNVLIFLAYLFTPWTAINLVDYFFVRKGTYVIGELFKRQSIYGLWGWRGNLAYLITLVVMVPFMVTAPYKGPLAMALGGVDITMFIGLPLAGLLYWLFCLLFLSLTTERLLAAEEGVLPYDR